MKLYVATGVGTATTLLSAFDKALLEAGVYNYNLIPLSSILPPGSEVIEGAYQGPSDEWGHKLYVVKAEMRSDKEGTFVGAGLGWYQLEDGRGMFVEHDAHGETHCAVELELYGKISSSLNDLCSFRFIPFKEESVKSVVRVAEVGDYPTCVLALAVYQSEGWK